MLCTLQVGAIQIYHFSPEAHLFLFSRILADTVQIYYVFRSNNNAGKSAKSVPKQKKINGKTENQDYGMVRARDFYF